MKSYLDRLRTLSGPLLLVCAMPSLGLAQTDYVKDVEVALERIAEECGELIERRGVDWEQVSTSFREQAAGVESDEQHLALLTRLLARLQDGQATVQYREKGETVPRPDWGKGDQVGPGLFLCRSDGRFWLKSVWSEATGAGLLQGMEVLELDGLEPAAWVAARIEELKDHVPFSTPTQAFFYATHWGLQDAPNTKLELKVRGGPKDQKFKRSIVRVRGFQRPTGPVVTPLGLKVAGEIAYGTTRGGFGYIHVAACTPDTLRKIDAALPLVGDGRGLVIDLRANVGGSIDPRELMGRFVPEGSSFEHGGVTYESRGPAPYGGNLVVIVDGTVLGGGEVMAGVLGQGGRAYLIGESSTAGAAGETTEIELPSGLFALSVSVLGDSAFNDGRGIEGIGIRPHEIVEYQSVDLQARLDTLIQRADELLERFPADKVPFKAKLD